jgi:hypothetical protein
LAAELYKLITCFLPSGRGAAVLERLRHEHGLSSAFYHHARGVGTGSRQVRRNYIAAEREIITVMVPAAQADDLFRFMFFAAGLDEPRAGMIFMERAARAVPIAEPPEPPAAPG